MKGGARRTPLPLHPVQNEINDHTKDEEQQLLPKLPDGFYEIEAVRKRRIRKGETQYLVKWRNWPESANTWEPVENLTSCADYIEAFEESVKNRSNRKRKGKRAVGPTPESKKKQELQLPQHSPDATYPIPSAKLKIIEVPLPIRSVHQSNFSNVTKNNDETFDQTNDSGSLTGSPQTDEKGINELDVTAGELKATSSTNQENKTEFAIHIHQDLGAEAEGVRPVEVRPTNVVSKVVDETEVPCVCPQIGAKRRKSCAVKRFKRFSNSAPKKDATEKKTDTDDVPVQDNNVKIDGDMGNGFDSENIVDTPVSVIFVTKIVKTVNYSTSVVNDTEEVCVSFLVQRSDGEEVIVDNKYLKENNPFLLINYYEKHLRGEGENGELLLSKFKWGHAFLSLNRELLKAYSKCENSAEIIAVQNSWLSEQTSKISQVLPKE